MTKRKAEQHEGKAAIDPDELALSGGGQGTRRYFGEGGYADGGANQQGNYEHRVKKKGPSLQLPRVTSKSGKPPAPRARTKAR